MKKLLILGLLLVSFVSKAQNLVSQPSKHVVLVSIDGLRPEFYLDPSFNTPNLRKLMDRGVYAKSAVGVFPTVTYPSHTTIVTGALPARHGVYFNTPYGASPGVLYWEESFIKTPTLWDAVKDAKLTSGAVMWPVTVGAPIDYNFPVRRAEGDDETDQLTVTSPFVSPKNLLDMMGKDFPLNKSGMIKGVAADQTYEKMASYIIRNYKPNLMAVHFIAADKEQHENGRDALVVKYAVAVVDSLIGELVKTVDQQGLTESTVFIITGDHGMINSENSFAPNVVLAQNGLLGKAKFATAGGSSFLYLKDPTDLATSNQVKSIFNNLPASQKKYFRLLDRNEMDKVGVNPDAALALAFTKGTIGGGSSVGEVIKPVEKGTGKHGYFPEIPEVKTGFIIAGPGVKARGVIPELGLKDVAPLISKILNLNFKAPDGILIPNILE